MQAPKPVDPIALLAQLQAAGMPVAALWFSFDNSQVMTLDDGGKIGEMPSQYQGVVSSYVYAIPSAIIAQQDYNSTYQGALTRLTDIIQNGSTYTAVQVRDALIDQARILRRMLRYLDGGT